jgi:hypothetical protein
VTSWQRFIFAQCSQSYDRELQRQRRKILNAGSSPERFENKHIFPPTLKKRYSLCTMYNAGVVVGNSEVVRLAPGYVL